MKETTADIQSLRGLLFKDEKTLRVHMLENARVAIDNMISTAKEMSENIFEQSEVLPQQVKDETPELFNAQNLNIVNAAGLNDSKPKQDEKNNAGVQIKKEDGIIKVDLGNGQFAKMKSSSLGQIKP